MPAKNNVGCSQKNVGIKNNWADHNQMITTLMNARLSADRS